MKILVGSTALKHHMPDIREPKDLDYLLVNPTPEELELLNEGQGVDVFTHPDLSKWNWSGEVPSLDELYTLKVSHSFWELKNGSWDKHMFDVVKMSEAGAKFIPELHAILYPIWVEKHGVKKANLELAPDEFFNPHVQRKYDHDSVHASVAYRESGIPLFNEILRDGHQVAVDRAKFEAMPLETKFQLVREEVYATALERRLIPSNYTLNPRVGYAYALRRTITSYTKGWFPLFIVLNFGELRKPDVNFVQIHHENANRLIPFDDKVEA
jgi:hypothetical protein